ncbi:MAG: NAD(P)-binding protein [Solirubrobacterales bacterium]
MPERFDAVIVGAGMAGGTIAATLAARHARVLCVEQGPWLNPTDYPHTDPLFDLRRTAD